MQIHIYAKQGNIAGVAHEIANGIDIDCIDKYTAQTPLMYAVTSPNADIYMMRFLVNNKEEYVENLLYYTLNLTTLQWNQV